MKTGRLRSIGCAFLFLVPLVLCGQFLFADCWLLKCPTSRSFNILEISQIPKSYFPSDSVFNYSSSPEEGWMIGVIEDGYMSVHLSQTEGTAVYWIRRFRTVGNAQERFERFFDLEVDLVPFADLSYDSLVADEFVVRCGMMDLKGEGCELLARYDEYFLSFNSSINDYMTVDKFIDIVFYLDQQVAERLKD